MATNEIMTFTLEVEGVERAINSIDDLEQAIRDVRAAIDANRGRGVLDNAQLDQNLRRLQTLREEARRTQTQIRQTGVDGAKSMGLLREGADGAGAALEILSGENSKVGFVVMTTMKAIGVANSVREVSENRATLATIANSVATRANIVVQKLYNASILSTIMSLNAFKIALAATGIGALILLIGAAIILYNKFSGSVDYSTEALERQKKAMDDLRRSKELHYREMVLQGKSETEINNQKIKDYNRQAQAYDRMTEGMRDNDVKVIAGENFTREQLKLRAREYRVLAGEAELANKKIREGSKKTTDDIKDDGKDLVDAIRQNQLRLMDDRSREIELVQERYAKELKLAEGNAFLTEIIKENERQEILKINEKYNKLEKEEQEKKDNELLDQAQKTAETLKKNRDDEFNTSLQNSKDYYDAQETLLINQAALGFDVSDKMRELELERLEAQKVALEDYGESTIDIEKQIAQKKKEIRDAERADLISSINAGLDVLGASIQASMDLEEVRKTNALKNSELTEEEREKIARESFEKQKRLQLQMAYVDAAKSITSIIAQYPKFDGGFAMYAALATTAIMNTAAISRIMKTQYEGGNPEDQGTGASKFARGGLLIGPRHSQGGIKTSFGELEGGEYVVNRNSTRMYPNLISAINMAGGVKKYAMGGMLGVEEQLRNMERGMKAQPVLRTYVLSGDISSSMEAEQKLRYRTTM